MKQFKKHLETILILAFVVFISFLFVGMFTEILIIFSIGVIGLLSTFASMFIYQIMYQS